MRKTLMLSSIILLFCSFVYGQGSTDRDVYMAAISHINSTIYEPAEAEGMCIVLRDIPAEPFIFGSLESDELNRIKDNLIRVNTGLDREGFKSYIHELFEGTEIKIASQDELRKIEGKRFWQKFFKTYRCSRGLTSLSVIWYDESKTTASVYVENMAHGLAGGGYMAVCVNDGGKWTVSWTSLVLQM